MEGNFREYLNQILRQLETRLGNDLVSVVLFGSVARGEADEGSDIDLLVVSESFKGSFGSRFDLFNEIERELLSSQARRRLRRKKLGTLISPVPLTISEVTDNPPILLDILTDGILLHDRNHFLENHLSELRRKLRLLGARKIYLPSGRWLWDLKPDWRHGENIEI